MSKTDEIIRDFDGICAVLAVTNDSPDISYIKEYFELYYDARLMELQTQN